MANSNEYIVFEADQVLTNDHLNEMFGYLDQQNRWTRNKLIGIGIVCGFELVLNPGVIQINRGCGVTSQGYLIVQDTTPYTWYIPYTPVDVPTDLPFTYTGNLPFYKPFCADKDIFLLLTDDQHNALDGDQQASAITISSAADTLANYAVVLFLEARETDLKNCDMMDCNNKGEKMVFQVRPLLVAKQDLPGAINTDGANGGTNTTTAAPGQITLKRYNVPFTTLNNATDVLSAFVKLVDDATLSQINDAYNFCFQTFGATAGVSDNPFTDLLSTLQGYRTQILFQNPLYIQYFYDFIDDLIKAYNEFIEKTNNIISACCPDENLFPLHLVLGAASQATSNYVKDSLRTYFIYSPLFSKAGGGAGQLSLLFNRMVIMVKYFTTQSRFLERQPAIRITPSRYRRALLSERAIPYYYTLNADGAELYKYWNYDKTIKGNAILNLCYNANLYNTDTAVTQPLLYDIEPYNFFRIEGHIGQNYQTVLANLVDQQSNYNLPFDIVAVSADQLDPNATLPNCNIENLDTDYKLLLSEATCKIHTPFCFVTKLPYTVSAAPANTPVNVGLAGGLKFSTFRLEQANLNLPIVILHLYRKGDFMRRYCSPNANTLGSVYLGALSASGVFTNPVQINQDTPLSIFYYYLLEFIDAVESLMYVLSTNTLEQINMDTFNAAYQTFTRDTTLAMASMAAITQRNANAAGDNNNQFVTFALDLELDYLVDEFAALVSLCIDERLQVLKTEYTTRLNQYQQQLVFLSYYKNHTGLEHKAGVPKGGTFVLVYHTAPATTSTGTVGNSITNAGNLRDIATMTGVARPVSGGVAPNIGNVHDTAAMTGSTQPVSGVASADASNSETNALNPSGTATTPVLNSINVDDTALSAIKNFVNNVSDVSAEERQALLNILNRVPVFSLASRGFTIPDGAVIADFYIPYLCCSDCAPVAYIMPQPVTPPPPPVKPVITMATTFCDNDANPSPITVSETGGTFNDVKGLDGTALTFTPVVAGAGTYSIVYTANGLASDPVSVTVLPTPVSTFSFQNNDVNQETIDATFTPDDKNDSFKYSWKFGPGFTVTESTDQIAKVSAHWNPAVPSTETFVTLQVSNGNCPGAEVTKKLLMSGNGFFEPQG